MASELTIKNLLIYTKYEPISLKLVKPKVRALKFVVDKIIALIKKKIES